MKQVARGNQILAVSNSIFWQENLASQSSASQVLMALKYCVLKGWKEKERKKREKKKKKERGKEEFSSISGKKYYLFTFSPKKNLCNFEQLRWNAMINNALNLQYWKEKKSKH